MSVSRSNQLVNFVLFLKDKSYPVDKFELANCLDRFRNDTQFFLSGLYFVQTDCTSEIFEQFLESCRTGKTPNLTFDNVAYFHQLSDEFEYTQMSNDCDKFWISSDKNEILNKIRAIIPKSSEKSNLDLLQSFEFAFARNLDLKMPSLTDFPLSIIYRIFSHKQRNINNQSKLLSFIRHYIQSNPNGEILLQTIEIDKVSYIEFDKVISEIVNLKKIPQQIDSHNQTKEVHQPPKAEPVNTKKEDPNPKNDKASRNQTHNQPKQSKSEKPQKQKQPNHQPQPENSQKQKQVNQPENPPKSRPNISSKPSEDQRFQSVYIPENSDLHEIENQILSVINTKRNRNFPLTQNIQVSAEMRDHYGRQESIPFPFGENDYLILEDAFGKEGDWAGDKNRFALSGKTKEDLINQVKDEFSKVNPNTISNSNFLAFAVIKVHNQFFCPILFGYNTLGRDQTQRSSDLDQIFKAFYQNDTQTIRDQVKSREITEYITDGLKNGTRIDIKQITEQFSMQKYQLYFKFGRTANDIANEISQLNNKQGKNIYAISLVEGKKPNTYVIALFY